MKLDSAQIGDDLLKVSLDGRLDIDGVRAIENRFGFLTTTHRADVIVDLSQVSFLASIGIRMLMTSARGQKGRGGHFFLSSAQPAVEKVLVMSGIDQLIPMHSEIESAVASVSAS